MGIKYGGKRFYLMGNEASSMKEVEIGSAQNMDDLRRGIAELYTIVKPEGD
jgi:hypothetical protein